MRLISDTVEVGGVKGPAHAKRYPEKPRRRPVGSGGVHQRPAPGGLRRASANQSPVAWNEEPGDRPGLLVGHPLRTM